MWKLLWRELLVYTLVGEQFFYQKGHSISVKGAFLQIRSLMIGVVCKHIQKDQKRWVTSAFPSLIFDILIVSDYLRF